MKARQILIGIVVLAVAGVLLLVFGKPRSASRGIEELVGTLVVPGFVPEEARAIEIAKSGAEPVRVRKGSGGWAVESAWGYPADPARVDTLLEAITELRVRQVRSTREASHPDFQVDEAEGVWVRVYDRNDTTLAELCAGKTVSYDRCFVRRSGSSRVFEVTPNLLQHVGATGADRVPRPTFLVNLRVLSLKGDDVRAITLERESGKVVLRKTEVEAPGVNPDTGEEETTTVTRWMIVEPEEEEADENTCRIVAGGLTGMMATEIAGERTIDECGLAPPAATVTLEFGEAVSGEATSGEAAAEAPPVTVLFGDKETDKDRYYAMTGEPGARIFIVSSYYRNLAQKDLNEFRKVKHEEPAEEAPEAAEEAPEAAEETMEAAEEEPEATGETPEVADEAPEAGETAPEQPSENAPGSEEAPPESA